MLQKILSKPKMGRNISVFLTLALILTTNFFGGGYTVVKAQTNSEETTEKQQMYTWTGEATGDFNEWKNSEAGVSVYTTTTTDFYTANCDQCGVELLNCYNESSTKLDNYFGNILKDMTNPILKITTKNGGNVYGYYNYNIVKSFPSGEWIDISDIKKSYTSDYLALFGGEDTITSITLCDATKTTVSIMQVIASWMGKIYASSDTNVSATCDTKVNTFPSFCGADNNGYVWAPSSSFFYGIMNLSGYDKPMLRISGIASTGAENAVSVTIQDQAQDDSNEQTETLSVTAGTSFSKTISLSSSEKFSLSLALEPSSGDITITSFEVYNLVENIEEDEESPSPSPSASAEVTTSSPAPTGEAGVTTTSSPAPTTEVVGTTSVPAPTGEAGVTTTSVPAPTGEAGVTTTSVPAPTTEAGGTTSSPASTTEVSGGNESTTATISPAPTVTLDPDAVQGPPVPDVILNTASPQETVTTSVPQDTTVTTSPQETVTTSVPQDTTATTAPQETETTSAPQDTTATAAPQESTVTVAPTDGSGATTTTPPTATAADNTVVSTTAPQVSVPVQTTAPATAVESTSTTAGTQADSTQTQGSTLAVGTVVEPDKSSTVAKVEIGEDGSAILVKGKASKTVSIGTVEINGETYTVTEVQSNAYKNTGKLKKVTLEKSVTKIGANAFAGCKNLKSVTFQSTKVPTIGKNAFKNINKKATIYVPKKALKAYKKKLKACKWYKKTMKIVGK